MTEIYLYGSVGASWWEEDYFTAKSVRDQLAGLSGPLTVRINSGGGIATEGQAIYTALRGYNGTVDVIIEGVAASAASLIAMAGDTITMTPGAILMIHDPANWYVEGRGTEDDHQHAANFLRVIANAYAGIYAKRSGMTVEEARAVMKAETYYDGPSAVAAGFATAVDEDGAELAPAAFDYRIYQHAPKGLLTAAGALARPQPRETVLAMMAGAARRPGKEGVSKMPKTKMTAATAAVTEDETMENEEDVTAAVTEDETMVEDEDDVEIEVGDDDDEDEAAPAAKGKKVTASGKVAARIIDLCVATGRDVTEARDMIAKGFTLEQAVTHVTAQASKEKPLTASIRPGAPTARITRDERDTRRIGMTEALVAQMSRAREVKGPARDFMTMGIMDMAAASIGHKGPVRRGAGELRVLEMALGSTTTSDFPAIFENALNKRLMQAYQMAEPTYREIATRMDFTDFRPHPISGMGDFPTLLPISETGEIKAGSTSDKKETVVLGSYGRSFMISRQMMINDDLGAIDRMLSSRGMAVAAFEERVFYSILLSGANADGPTLTETGRQIFATADGTKAASGAAITVDSLAAGRAAMRKQTGLGREAADRIDLNITPSIIHVGPDKETEAEQLLSTIQATQATNVNPFSGKLKIVTSARVVGNSWRLFADPNVAPVMMYGYLAGEEGPRMRMDEPFGTQGVSYSVELDFGAGAIDYRGGYKNAGN
jgi:ATP-dependent protease ClpP protease subunit/phage major head subunit gpT-like protein